MKKIFLRFTVAGFCLILISTAVAAQITAPKQDKREADLLELVKLDGSIKLDIRYARTDNFVGKVVYSEARAFLQRPAAEALVRVHKQLKKQGLGLAIFDGYRPWSVTKLFWEVTPADQRKYVANPKTGSRHNRGCAVDLTLFDRKTGKLVPMPSEFDEFNERSSPDFKGGTDEERRNRDLLRRSMEAEGFTVNSDEWWHFDYKDWQSYSIYDISFDDAGSLDRKPKPPSVRVEKSWKKFFDDAGVTGGTYVYDLNQNKLTVYDRKRLDTEFIPASTSKIIHSLIFLDSGAIKDENETLKWDGTVHRIEAWNRDQNLRTAFKASAVWFYLDVSRRLTKDAMQRYYDAAKYGNRSTEGFGDPYWVKGDLRITPRQQIDFLVNFHRNRLPFSPQVINIVKDIMIEEKTANYTLRAKTGWADAYTPQVGWWVGYVERAGNAYFFATELDIKSDADAPKRKEITRAILKSMGIIEN
ncbi:MAG: class D beta-lactamase [Acidobacteria bacterium]|nr:class D beta-lactamase [Acidobacteriota bacterium]